MRVIFYYYFKPQQNLEHVFTAFYLGAKFDIRIACVLVLPFYLLNHFFINLIKNKKWIVINFWTVFYSLIFFIILLFYGLDFGHYSYLNLRANATVLTFAQNPMISAQMLWESYPIFWIFLGFGFLTFCFYDFIKRQLVNIDNLNQSYKHSKGFKSLFHSLIFLSLVLFGIYGKLSAYPLRWSEAFFSSQSFITSLTLNPIHYFFDTFSNHELPYDKKLVAKYYPIVSEYLGVDSPNLEKLNFDRWIKPIQQLPETTNIIIIVMESFAAHKTGILGHPLDTTPNFDNLAKNGKLFSNFQVPSESTARSMFGLITGIPDVNENRTSSRNPLIVDQNSGFSAFVNHEKFYFLGGSANWGNIRGVISNNIPNINIIEEGMFEKPATDVWGISDYQLFEEAHNKFMKSKKPFLGLIQTAGFHRPYTIPEGHDDFEIKQLSNEEVKKYGFVSNEEYNSLRFSDFSLGHFLKLAENSPYFSNTLIAILGDHGLPDLEAQHLNNAQIKHHLTRFHVPFLIFHPKWNKGEVIKKIATQPDIMITLASMTGHKMRTRTFGRDLFDKSFDDKRWAFHYVYYRQPPYLSLLTENFYLISEPNRLENFYNLTNGEPIDKSILLEPRNSEYFYDLTQGLYQTAKYLLYHNPKRFDE